MHKLFNVLIILILWTTACRDRDGSDASLSTDTKQCDKPWVFFDLGNTLVDTKTFDFKKVLYMPKALAYITDLHEKNYTMGMIINVPDTWGATLEEKFAFLKNFISERWIEKEPFPWVLFEPNILLPPKDLLRKPNPFLFQQAAKSAHNAGCAGVYEGEVEEEMKVAREQGLVDFRVGQTPEFFMPESKLREIGLGAR